MYEGANCDESAPTPLDPPSSGVGLNNGLTNEENQRDTPSNDDSKWRLIMEQQNRNFLTLIEAMKVPSAKKDIQLPEFNPEKDNVNARAWLTTADMCVTNPDLQGPELMMALSRSLKGQASAWLSQVSFHGMTWTNFKELFTARYECSETATAFLINLQNGRPKENECLASYAASLMSSIMSKWQNLSVEQIAVSTILAHISQFEHRIQRLCFTQDITTRNGMQQELKATSFMKRKSSSQTDYAHDAKRPRQNTEVQVKCYVCGKMGHKAIHCRSGKGTTNKDVRPKILSGDIPSKKASMAPSITCYSCGSVGHYANNCPRGRSGTAESSTSCATGLSQEKQVNNACVVNTPMGTLRHAASTSTLCRRSFTPNYHLYEFDASKISKESKLKKAEALQIYNNMVLIRRMETEIANLYKSKKVYGFCHMYVGTEAVGCGLVANMKPVDNLITSYRCHGFAMIFQNQLGKDGLYTVTAELGGKYDGVSLGKGGSMHIYVPPYFFGGQGIVGGQVPLANGLAFAHKYTNNGGVAYALYGDGAANQGQVYESFNLAKLLKLPIVFVCENNQYGMGTAAKRSSANTEYYKAFRVIPGIKADGMDVVTVREVFRAATEYVRGGNGPIIVQMETYRYYGHSMSDPGTSYRSREEVAAVRKEKDPINLFTDVVLKSQLATDKELEEINKKAKAWAVEARKKTEKAKDPEMGLMYEHVYVKYLEPIRKRTIAG